MLGLVGATVGVMTFTYLVVRFECLLLSMMWFICAAWFQTNKRKKRKERNNFNWWICSFTDGDTVIFVDGSLAA